MNLNWKTASGLRPTSVCGRHGGFGLICSISSFVLEGITATPCQVEVSIARGQLSGTTLVGLPDTAVRESIE